MSKSTKPTKPVTIEVMSAGEVAEFDKLDKIINAGANTFMEVGKALVRVHEGKLYRSHFKTFQSYAEDRGISRAHAYRLMEKVQFTLEIEKMSLNETRLTPENIEKVKAAGGKVVGAVANVPKKDRAAVLKLASEQGGGKITVQTVRRAAKEVAGHKSKPQPTQKIGGGFNPVLESAIPDPQKPAEMTPERFKVLLLEIEGMIPEGADHKKFADIASQFINRQMDLHRKKSEQADPQLDKMLSAYTS